MTNKEIKGFGSDNHATIHPDILESIIRANHSHAHSYGSDPLSENVSAELKKIFGSPAVGFFVFNGTAANILALKAVTKSYQSVLCSDVAHIDVDECGGPEAHGHFKLIPVPSKNGKVTIEELKRKIIRKGDQHYSQVRTLSLTQPTELGTCYTFDELKSLIEWAKSENLFVHIDGARFANSAIALNKSFKELTLDLGVDVISFGGTKNGLLGGEIVIFLNPKLGDEFKYLRKQMAQLPSKSRFIAAQFQAYFKNELWKDIARKSVQLAQYLAQQLEVHTKLKTEYPVESNAVFVKIPKPFIKELKKEKFFYVWDESTFVCRLMLSWDNETSDIDNFIQAIKQLETTTPTK